jgi:hypothetical protein
LANTTSEVQNKERGDTSDVWEGINGGLTGIPQFSVLLSLNEHLPLGTDDGGCKRQVNDLYPALYIHIYY